MHFYIYSTSQLWLVVFQVLNSYTALVTTTLCSAEVDVGLEGQLKGVGETHNTKQGPNCLNK